MTITALDTHEIVKDLTSAGFTESQAEAVTRWVRKSQDLDLSDLATKADIQVGLAGAKDDLAATKTELQASISATRAELQANISTTRAELQASIAETKAELQTSMAETKAELQASIAETKADILKWVVGTIGLQTVVILGALVALARIIAH